MPQKARLWKISNDKLTELFNFDLEAEKKLEIWLEEDISLISKNYLVIGRQVTTDYGHAVDLLCLDENGDVVIIELKRARTPRNVTAQILDYGAWVEDLSYERLEHIANEYFADKSLTLDDEFEKKFSKELPESLNEHHKMIIVATEIDNSTERIVNYLSDSFGVDINVITFQFFQEEEGSRFVTRVFTIEPKEVEQRVRTGRSSKSRRRLSREELNEMAKENDVQEIYKEFTKNIIPLFDRTTTSKSSLTLKGSLPDSPNTILNVFPGDSSLESGLKYQVYPKRCASFFSMEVDELEEKLPGNLKDASWENGPPRLESYFSKPEEVRKFERELLN